MHASRSQILYGDGIEPQDVGFLCALGISAFAFILMLFSLGCGEAMMHDFYKLHEVKPTDPLFRAK